MNDVETDQTQRLHERYPRSVAFSDWMNRIPSFEERLLEFKLENEVSNAKAIFNEQKKQFTKQSIPYLINSIALPDMMKFRSDREFCLRTLSQVSFPEPLQIEADFSVEEVSFISLLYVFSCFRFIQQLLYRLEAQ